jgi:hypothetical protein
MEKFLLYHLEMILLNNNDFEYYKYRDEECTKWQIDLRNYEIIDENHITTNSAPSWLKTK